MGKKLLDLKKKVQKNKLYMLSEAVEFLQQNTSVAFDETLDIAIELGVDAKNSAHNIKGSVMLPHGSGKDIKIAVICPEILYEKAQEAGADLVGGDDIIEDIKQKKIKFDVCICTPEMIKSVTTVARILGSRGLMPNPKNNSLTSDFASSIQNIRNGQIDYKMDKEAMLYAGIGKLSFPLEHLVANIKFFIQNIKNARPKDFKAVLLKKLYLSSTMGLSFKINLLTI